MGRGGARVALWLALAARPGDARRGLLHPQESESRELKSLDGLWRFHYSAHVDGRLKRARTGAKTASDEGELDSYRRALSATIDVDPYDGDDAATRVSERVFALAREVAGLRAWLPGQEALSVIEYGANDEYRPHCDGNCAGGPYERGQRAATAIAFCETAARGGATAFTRGGLVITPRPRQLLLFAYKHANGSMDDGHTEHSGCPVDEGRTWIVTQWLREDVSLEQPWFSFDNW